MRLCPKGDSGLELRVDLDGFSPETRDPIRGPGTFKRFLRESNFCPRTPPSTAWRLNVPTVGWDLNPEPTPKAFGAALPIGQLWVIVQ
jgi:hypothetical protein